MRTQTNVLLGAALGLLLPCASATAAVATEVTFDFDGTPNQLLLGPVEEDGFVLTPVSGDFFVTDGVLDPGVLDSGETLSFTRQSGGLFSFVAFDYFTDFDGDISDSFSIVGLLGGTEVRDFGTFVTMTTAVATFTATDRPLIDELRIVGDVFGLAPVFLDNFVFEFSDAAPNPIPLPAAFPLMACGVFSLLLKRSARATASH